MVVKIKLETIYELIILFLLVFIIFIMQINISMSHTLVNKKPTLFKFFNGSSNYTIIHKEINPYLNINYTNIGYNQTNITFKNTIVTTWVFVKDDDYNHKVIVRLFQSLRDYINGNTDPRAYFYYCDTKRIITYYGSGKYILKNSLMYYLSLIHI